MRKKMPDYGVCSVCGKEGKYYLKGKKICKTCYYRNRVGICKGCGKEKRLYVNGYCYNCYWKLNLNKRKVVCKRCGKIRVHYARGLCRSCYSLNMVKSWQKRNPEKVRGYNKKYYQKHRERFREYWKKEIT